MNFSGSWMVNLSKSMFRGAAPAQVLIEIEHAGNRILQRTVVTQVEGIERLMTFTYHLTGEETIHPESGGAVRSVARWEGAELLIESWMKTAGREFHFKDYWSLSADGSVLTMAHRDDDLAGQISVLEKI